MTVRIGLLYWDLKAPTLTRFKKQTRKINRKTKVRSLVIIMARIYWEVTMDKYFTCVNSFILYTSFRASNSILPDLKTEVWNGDN